MKNLFSYVNPIIFLIAFSLGLLYMEYFDPRVIVIQNPNPFNYTNISYKKKNGNCYKFEMNTTTCPKDISNIKSF